MAMKLVVTKEECPLFLISSAMKPSVFKNKSYWFYGRTFQKQGILL